MNWPYGITLYRGHAWFASPQAAEIDGERPMTRVARTVEKGGTQGFMRILVDGDSAEILAPHCSVQDATRCSRDPRSEVCQSPVQGDAARDAHPSHCFGADFDNAG